MKTFKQFITEQPYQFTIAQAKQLWDELNHACFNNALHGVNIIVEPDLNHLAHKDLADKLGTGYIIGYCDEDPDTGEIVILLANKMSGPHELMKVLAHEMVHQALAEKHGYKQMLEIGHGSQFTAYAPAIKRYHNLELFGATYNESLNASDKTLLLQLQSALVDADFNPKVVLNKTMHGFIFKHGDITIKIKLCDEPDRQVVEIWSKAEWQPRYKLCALHNRYNQDNADTIQRVIDLAKHTLKTDWLYKR